jgi:hypothetical protein
MKQGKIIGYELENRREHRRIMMPPIQIEIEGTEYTTVDWSLGGFMLAPYAGRLKVGATVPITIIATTRGDMKRHFAIAEIVRVERLTKSIAGHFDRLDPRAVDSLERVILERLHGLKE